MGGYGLNSTASVYGQVAGSREHGNDPSNAIKCGKVLD
jgi:hypothetical protein